MQIRKETDTDVGVGKSIILGGTGPYKKLANKECLYAKVFKRPCFCNYQMFISDNTYNLLKN